MEVDVEVLEQAAGDVVDPAVDCGGAAFEEVALDDGVFDDVQALLADVEFDEAAVSHGRVFDGVEFCAVKSVDVADFAEPSVEDAEVAGLHGGAYAAAVVMSTNDDVVDLEVVDGKVDGGCAV